VKSVKKTCRALVVHEAVERCGIGAEISAVLNEKAFDYLDAPVTRLAGLNVSLPRTGTWNRHASRAPIRSRRK
jgi:pyruvate dehydrogenase E1 component beta subunit